MDDHHSDPSNHEGTPPPPNEEDQNTTASNNTNQENPQRRSFFGTNQIRNIFNHVVRRFNPIIDTIRTLNEEFQNAMSFTEYLREASVFTGNNDYRPNNRRVAEPQRDADGNIIAAVDQQNPRRQNERNNNNNRSSFNFAAELAAAMLFAGRRHIILMVISYVLFGGILIGKLIVHHLEGILIVAIIFGMSFHSDWVVKAQARRRRARNIRDLLLEILLVSVGTAAIYAYFWFNIKRMFNGDIMESLAQAITFPDLLWAVVLVDLVLKQITIVLKILIILIPSKLISFHKRGNLFYFVEAFSQLARGIAPIHQWLKYLLHSNDGIGRTVAVLLTSFYISCKMTDLIARIRSTLGGIFRLFKSVSIGRRPSKEELKSTGNLCPICHDVLRSPVILQCRHIFCESCVSIWFEKERSCPMCRANIMDDPSWKDGATSHFVHVC